MTFTSRFFLCVIVMMHYAPVAAEDIAFDVDERALISAFGPWPLPSKNDPSNKASGQVIAIELGKKLFEDRRFSEGQKLACRDCHQPEFQFADSLALNRGMQPLHRHTPSLLNVRWNNWFGWAGSGDSLWMQSLRPIVTSSEMNMGIRSAANIISNDAKILALFDQIFEPLSANIDQDQALFVRLGKTLAAYQETLTTEKSQFDLYRDALVANDLPTISTYPKSAVRGLKLFIGKGNCHLCHFGPLFTNGEFADIGISQFIAVGEVDKGRYEGIQQLLESPYNQLGPYNDDPTAKTALRTKYVSLQHRNFGEFKIPSLRNIGNTAPYMHAGSLTTLEDVVEHYSELDIDRLHQDGEKILRPLKLNGSEKADLVAFLKTL